MDTEKLFQAGLAYAQGVIIGKQKQLAPTWTLMNQADELTVLVTPWQGDTEKLLTEMALRVEMQERKTVAYSLVTEAWSAVAPEGWAPGTGRPLVEPRKRPDRKKIVLAFVADGESVTSRVWTIKRDWHERATYLELDQSLKVAEHFEGWMTRLLN